MENLRISIEIAIYLRNYERDPRLLWIGSLIGSWYPIIERLWKPVRLGPNFSGGFPYRLINSDQIQHRNPCMEGYVSMESTTPFWGDTVASLSVFSLLKPIQFDLQRHNSSYGERHILGRSCRPCHAAIPNFCDPTTYASWSNQMLQVDLTTGSCEHIRSGTWGQNFWSHSIYSLHVTTTHKLTQKNTANMYRMHHQWTLKIIVTEMFTTYRLT